MPTDVPAPASLQDGSYPRPQLVRAGWADLSGPWGFDYDDDDQGVADGWMAPGRESAASITVPYPPESSLSGIGDTGFHPVVWYRRRVDADEVRRAGHADGRQLVLHFGAVDYSADVWIDGAHVGSHEGGHTPFAVPVPASAGESFEIVVRAHDDPHDLSQPRGKQDWQSDPHVIWYPRTTGIWQTVWLESVPAVHVRRLGWSGRASDGQAELTFELGGGLDQPVDLRVHLDAGDERLATMSMRVDRPSGAMTIPIAALANGQDRDRLTWSPEHPALIDATVELVDADGRVIDVVRSYFGLRSVATGDGRFLLNARPYRIVGVLSQGFWPESHLAAPSPDALRAEVQLIKDLGFTTARIHQKIEDPRFLYWADRLGLLVWTELPSVYEFGSRAIQRLVAEWIEVIERDRSHPSVVAWVPLNESWGVGEIAHQPAQQQFARTLFHLTKSLDGTRPVISNDGWEHTESDLVTLHDYENDPERLAASYADAAAIAPALAGISANRRRTFVGGGEAAPDSPIVLSEFGGVSITSEDGDWGYRVVSSTDELDRQLAALFGAVRSSAVLSGWVYTQLTDTAQETNGLTDANRVPKLPIERIRQIVTGS